MRKIEDKFDEEYKKLNKAQSLAVDLIDGPVMVVAGPGTGKTQILALRIGNILKKTDTKADSILCLTFTNSAALAMKNRLGTYIGETGQEVNTFTFHSFGMKIIESYFELIGFKTAPKLLDDADTAILFDEILNGNEWEYLRPRSDASRYFSDLRSLISLLKRERITGEEFLLEVEKEIKSVESDPDNISTRGNSKGELKKEVLSKIEGLRRSREVVKFFDLYEKEKNEKNKENVLIDYDDVLENLVKIVEVSKDARSDIQEKYLYVLVDEHQDSSRVQNEFLKTVWGKVEHPNIMVVGDDRQLIYGFSGASIDHFQGFKKTFKDAKLITLVDNYRSTQVILDASHALLQSVMTEEKLVSQSRENHPIRIFEAEYPRDEIIACAEDIKARNINPRDCAILVPKNSQVRQALEILHEMGLVVSSEDALNLFDQKEANALFRVLKIVSDSSNSGDISSLALSFFDSTSLIDSLQAHTYLAQQKMRDFSLDNLMAKSPPTLFNEDDQVGKWIQKLRKWKDEADNSGLLELVEKIGSELLLRDSAESNELVTPKEVLDTILALAAKEIEKNPSLTLSQFVAFITRLESYGEHLPVVVGEKDGVKVLTLHSSKGLEFDYVWIAHMDERSLNSGKKMSFTLPDKISQRIEERDVDKVKRKLYVAITRAKRFCTLSYSIYSSSDSAKEVARVIQDLPEGIFEKQKVKSAKENVQTKNNRDMSKLLALVGEKYQDRYVSVSLLNNFFECPWKWYFRNLLGLPEPESEILEFGSLVHASIDRILSTTAGNSIPIPDEVEAIVTEEVLKQGFQDERKRQRMVRGVLKVILSWVKNRLPEIKLSRKTEEGISVKDDRFPHLKIFGKIDLIENLDRDSIRVTDFKTGSVKRKGEIEKIDDEGRMSNYLRQLVMYSYLIQQSPMWKVEVRESRLEFVEVKNPRPARNAKGIAFAGGEAFYDTVINQDHIEKLIKDMKDYDQLVKSGDWINRPCNYNSYGKNTECEYCQMAKIYTDR